MTPLAAHASDLDLQLKIDKLAKEVNDLKDYFSSSYLITYHVVAHNA